MAKKSAKAEARPRAAGGPRETTDDQELRFIADCCRDLDTKYDEAARRMLFIDGIFSNDMSVLVESLVAEDRQRSQRAVAIEARLRIGREKAYDELESIVLDEKDAAVDAAYLLGIAVGKRLGPGKMALDKRPLRRRRQEA